MSAVNPYIPSLWQSRNFDKKLNKTIIKIVQNNPKLKQKYDLISNIKGAGFRAVRCFTGPALYVNWKSHISKIGSERDIKLLYMSALSVRRYNPDFAHFVQKMKYRDNAPKITIRYHEKTSLHFLRYAEKNDKLWQKTCIFFLIQKTVSIQYLHPNTI